MQHMSDKLFPKMDSFTAGVTFSSFWLLQMSTVNDVQTNRKRQNLHTEWTIICVKLLGVYLIVNSLHEIIFAIVWIAFMLTH